MANFNFLSFELFIILHILSICKCESTDGKLKIGENMPVVVFDSSGHLEAFHGLSINRNEEIENSVDTTEELLQNFEQVPATTPMSLMLERCLAGESADCCYKFTWPGYIHDYEKYSSNSTCARYKGDKKFPNMACYDPLVFTNASGRPNLDHMRELLSNRRQIIHCSKSSGQTCIKYSYYRGNQLVNETRFCGSVSDSDSSSQIRTGCFRQYIESSPLVREVCTCEGIGDDGHPCNFGSSICIFKLNIFIRTLIITFVLKFY